jgi:hypothetical protein
MLHTNETRRVNQTPPHWCNVRIEERAPGRFQIVTHYVFVPFGPMAKKALGLAPETETDDLPLEEALALGEKLEAILAAGAKRTKRN